MRNLKTLLTALFGMLCILSTEARAPEKDNKPNTQQDRPANFRENCTTAQGRIDQAVNNVRARLNQGGDVWWDRSNGNYIIPKVANDETPVSSIFAGAVWLGGVDPGGNLKTACQAYGNASGESDFWAGPIEPETGRTSKDTCDNWDRFWVVTKNEVEEHLFRLANRNENGVPYTEDQIPLGVKGWPARGNEFFEEINLFALPNTDQGLAGFFDADGDTQYEPLEGDYPIIEIRGCLDLENLPPPPDEMIFWIYNDAGDFGNIHGETQGEKILMEVQVQAFAYARNDEINDMTFQRYKLINRAQEDIDSTFFAMWVDADLGCADDDFVGCDTARELAYVYNSDAVDGISGITCNGVPTYGTNIPILGIDYFRGPLDEFRDEIGMSSFTYYHRGGQGTPPGTNDPNSALEYYRYLSGSWGDGTPFQFGGDGYAEASAMDINYAFPSPPDGNLPTDWSSCNPGDGAPPLQPLDRRTIQASGPFKLVPSAVNELIVGVVWVADQAYPCPSLNRLLFVDETAQALFNNCFKLNEGPDAPDVDWVELDREIIAVLSNDTSMFVTNNVAEQYFEVDAFAPDELADTVKAYQFEGYLVYQFSGPNVNISEREDPEKARLIRQVDVNNGISKIYNWSALEDVPAEITEEIWIPNLQVDGADEGVRHTFRITTDAFASGDTRLINHKKYYYSVLAYGYNEYEAFDPDENTGQRRPFIAGSGNIGDGNLDFYTVIPRPITDESLNSAYGQGAPVTRLDGVGAGGNFLDITDETRDRMFEAGEADKDLDRDDETSSFDGIIEYVENRGPLEIQIYNPLEVRDGRYELTFIDDNMDNSELDSDVRWRLTDLDDPSFVFESKQDISTFNDEVLADLGITIGIGQTNDVGTRAEMNNGAIGNSFDYADNQGPEWFRGLPDEFAPVPGEGQVPTFYDLTLSTVLNYVPTDVGEPLDAFDPFQGLTNIGDGSFFPFLLGDFRNRAGAQLPFYLSPMWRPTGNLVSTSGNLNEYLPQLRNVDIVMTSDKSKWSRCVIVEMRTPDYNTFPIPTGEIALGEGDRDHFQTRSALSVGKEDSDGDGLPDPDGDVWTDEDGDSGERRGMGWFPGYAVDVETGERLNIFFGENSVYAEENGLNNFYTGTQLDRSGTPVARPTGRDMMFNPTDQAYLNLVDPEMPNFQAITVFDYMAGGQHWIYVDGSRYDECEFLHSRLDPDRQANQFAPVSALKEVQWACLPVLPEGQSMLSYADGLVPNDLTIKLRVDNPYQARCDQERCEDDPDVESIYGGVWTGTTNDYPTYQFTLEGVESDELTDETRNEALDAINVVPNPYYAFSDYESNVNEQLVKITNLPAKCTVTIYSLDGKFIRQYDRDELPANAKGSGIPSAQIIPDIEWDLKNNKGISISSGVYLIHVDARASGWGERTLKWFGINRKFDASGL